MTNKKLFLIAYHLYKKYFHKNLKCSVVFAKKADRHLFGQFDPNVAKITINPKLIKWFNYSIFLKVVKHELCHYCLFSKHEPCTHTQNFYSLAYRIHAEPWNSMNKKYNYYKLFYANRNVYMYIDMETDYIHTMFNKRPALNCNRRRNHKDFYDGTIPTNHDYVYLGSIKYPNRKQFIKITQSLCQRYNKYLSVEQYSAPYNMTHAFRLARVGQLIRKKAKRDHIKVVFTHY